MKPLLLPLLAVSLLGATQAYSDETDLRAESPDELFSLLKEAEAAPYVNPATGNNEGLVVKQKSPNEVFEKLELRQGETITGANEAEPDTTER